ncbi:hypothetical protein [Pseudoalteromonas sp. S558]|uniref:hypothetical protein n=1 Tax=Pseudoalteromonas sp. S558 TaxID=2066515 RepID=UPI00110B6872|nr:hypothetical protein [Pseudoalteromonas sp. S558]TMO05025.1 hypothetical protein CWB66_07405 [Pseudoalteromonas sp. S558]
MKSHEVVFHPEDSLFKKAIFYTLFTFLTLFFLFLVYLFFNEALKLIQTINDISEGKIYFLKQKGKAFGFICFIPLLFILAYMFAHGIFNRRPSKKILGLVIKVAVFCSFLGIPTMIISSISMANYFHNEGFVNCTSYSPGMSLDFYVYDEQFCNEEGVVISYKIKKWLLEQNGQGEPSLEEFNKVISLYLSEYYELFN